MLMHYAPYIALVYAFALGVASGKITNLCNIWCIMHLCIQYSIHKPEAFKDGEKTEASVYRALDRVQPNLKLA